MPTAPTPPDLVFVLHGFVGLDHSVKGGPKTLKLSSGGRAPCSTGFLCQESVVGTHLYQCTSWRCCERLHLASVNFFLRLFQCGCPFHDDLQVHLLTVHSLSVQQFCTKNIMTPMSHPPYSPDLIPRDFLLFPWMKKVLKGKHFANVKEVKQKNSRNTKRHQNQKVQKLS